MIGSTALLLALTAIPYPRHVVAARGYDAPKSWEPIPIRGRTFYTLFSKHHEKLHKTQPRLAMFDNPWLEVGFPCPINDRTDIDTYMQPEKAWTNRPVRMSEIYAHYKVPKATLDDFERRFPGNPFTIVLRGGRRVFNLKESFDTDAADFAAWRKEHPGFFSFCAFDEYDADSSSLTWQWKRDFKHPEIKERLVREYGLENLGYGYPRRWAKHDFQKARSFHMGSPDLYALWSVEPSMAHLIASLGPNFLWYEAEHGSVASPWRWGAAYSRGAARQFRIPFGWYTAMFTFNTVKRDGKSPEGEDGILMWRDSFTYWPNPDNKKTIPHLGSSRSLLRRNVRYGYFIGTLLSCIECASKSIYKCGGPDGNDWELSQYGEDYEELCRWHRNHDRGAVYTPVAMLASMDEGVHRQGYNTFPAKDEGSIISFFHVLVPSRAPAANTYCDPEHGLEGCLWNSEFGEILDVLAPDSGQDTDAFLKALSDYKAAFMVGYHDPKLCDRKAIADYVRGGGTLFCSYDQVADGLVAERDAGVAFGDATVIAGKTMFDEKGAAVEEIREQYTLHVPSATNAVPFLKDENGSVIAWSADCGRGRVVTVTARRMMPDKFLELKEDGWKTRQWYNCGYYKSVHTGARTFPIVHYLLKRVQSETMPIDVAGDIQWGLNRTKDGWMLWLINNNGIKKFAREPEELDLSKTSVVTVCLKDLAGADVADVTDVEKSVPLAVRNGRFSVAVKPGEDRRIYINLK